MSSSNSLDHIGVIECVETNESTNECFTTDDEMGSCFVAVHIGAGFHSQSKTPTYKLLCEKICSSVIKMLNKGSSARKAAAFAVALLEVSMIYFFIYSYSTNNTFLVVMDNLNQKIVIKGSKQEILRYLFFFKLHYFRIFLVL
jgi:hypothetical protein